MTIFTPHANWTREDYRGPASLAASSIEILLASLYIGAGAMPVGGRRTWICPQGGGFRFTCCPNTIDTTAADGTIERTLGRILESGDNVLVAAMPIARGWAGQLPGGVMQIEFAGALALQNLPAMVINSAGLTGGGSYVVATTVQGSGSANEIQTITASGTITGGTWTVAFNGSAASTQIAWNADPPTVVAALVALSTIGPGDVISGTKQSGNAISDVLLNLDNWTEDGTQHYGAAYNGNGQAVWDPAGTLALPPFYDGVLHPKIDPSRPCWPQAACMLSQWVAANCTDPDWQCNPDLIVAGVAGSAPGDMMLLAAFGGNLAPEFFPGGVGQDALDTRIYAAAAATSCQAYFLLLPQTPSPCPATQPTPCFINSFPQKPSGAGDSQHTHYDKPAISLGQTGSGYLGAASIMRRLALDATLLAAAGQIPLWLGYTGTDDVGAPYDITQTVKTGDVHSVWWGGGMATLLASSARLCLFSSPGLLWSGPHDTILTDPVLQDEDMLAFIHDALPLAGVPGDPVETQVVVALKDRLATITTANGYLTNVKMVFEGGKLLSAAPEYPCIEITAIETAYDDGICAPYMQGIMKVEILLAHKSWADQAALTSRFIADVMKALQTKFEADKFDTLFHNFHILRCERIVADPSQSAATGATLEVQIIYRHQLTDPYTAVGTS